MRSPLPHPLKEKSLTGQRPAGKEQCPRESKSQNPGPKNPNIRKGTSFSCTRNSDSAKFSARSLFQAERGKTCVYRHGDEPLRRDLARIGYPIVASRVTFRLSCRISGEVFFPPAQVCHRSIFCSCDPTLTRETQRVSG